ncbi:PKD-like family lipoprotein [Sphingobacterium faecale]|uniref:PKD family protein n=1 Tax=Sphingobacterium faecale TaxID=2803775 RepID=A0ABS1R6S9_9SPHI|nr:PKD-like family lipoprotein [Sphingobacterium faecale]MBL1410417.1 hypothetical protein [Sphingobacterium faecale]
MIKLISILLVTFLCIGCYKDKGNYQIDMPIAPEVSGLDTLYEAFVGDSLVIAPQIKGLDRQNLQCEWRIDVPEALDTDDNQYEGESLRIVFGLQAKRYRARLTVTNTANGMKYFHSFIIQGRTEFSKGTLVLSDDQGTTKLSFIKEDGTVQPNIYEAINREQLPASPLGIFFLSNQFTGNTPLAYWIISKTDGVRLDVNNLKKEEIKPGTLQDNFFLAPSTIDVGSIVNHPQGVMMGIVNGKFYGGTTSTWDQSNTYGMFGTYAEGDYELSPQFVMSTVNGSYSMIAFEKNKKQFVRINVYGAPTYFGSQYTSINPEVFNPANVGLDLLKIVQINNSDTYAFMKDGTGQVFELKFNVNFNGPFTFTSGHKRVFQHPEWIHENTPLVATRNGNIYMAVQNKVYRYNPINQQTSLLEASFSGTVTLLKVDDDDNTLIVGADNGLHYLDVQAGKNGNLIKKISGIPGQPIDVASRK